MANWDFSRFLSGLSRGGTPARADTAHLIVTKEAAPSPVRVGEALQFLISVFNAGPSVARDIVVSDLMPESLLPQEYSLDGSAWLPWTGSYTHPSLNAGWRLILLLRGTVQPGAGTELTNTVTAVASTPDPDPTGNTATVVVPVLSPADLSLAKQASPNPVLPNQTITYTLTAANAGPGDAHDVLLTDALPSGLQAPEYSIGGSPWLPWGGSVALGILPAYSSVEVLVRGSVAPSITGSLRNTAEISSSTPDPDYTNNLAQSTTTVLASADLSLMLGGSPKPVAVGGQITYTINLFNAGPSDAGSVTLTDSLPSGLTAPEYSLDNGGAWHPWGGSVSLGDLPNGGMRTVLLRAFVLPDAPAALINTATVTSATPDPDSSDNSATDYTAVVRSADLSVAKLAQAGPVGRGKPLTYTIIASNAGPSYAEHVLLRDDMPDALLQQEFSLDEGITWELWSGSYMAGTLANGASFTLLLRGIVSGSAQGVIVNHAELFSSTPDPNYGNNIAQAITPVETSADLSLMKSSDVLIAIPGQPITYTVTVANAGPDAALDTVITDAFPGAVQSPEYSTDGGATWNPWGGSYPVGELPEGAGLTLLLRGLVSAQASGVLVNTAEVESTTPDPNPANNIATLLLPVGASANLSLTKTASPSPAVPGETLTYTLTIRNAGPNPALDTCVLDELPPQLLSPEYSVDGGSSWAPWGGFADLGTLAPDETRVLLLRGALESSAIHPLVNNASVSSSTPDPNPANGSAQVETALSPTANLSISKSASPTVAVPGEPLTYTLTVQNAGPSDAAEVHVMDAVPSALSGPEFSIDSGVTWQPWKNPLGLGTLPAGATRTILLRGMVRPSAIGSLLNTAAVLSATPDSSEQSNTASLVTPVAASADLTAVKLSAPIPAVPGEEIIYAVIAGNAGPSDAPNAVLIDALPPQIQNPAVSTDMGLTWQPWVSPFPLGTLAAGEAQVVLIRATLARDSSGQLTNTATVISTVPDPNPDDNSSTNITPVRALADLSITKHAVPALSPPCGWIIYPIAVTNTGPGIAENAVLFDNPPEELERAHYSRDGGETWQPWSGFLLLGSLAPGAMATILLTGRVRSCVAGAFSNTAYVFSSTADPNYTNNVSSAEVRVCVPVPVCPAEFLPTSYSPTVRDAMLASQPGKASSRGAQGLCTASGTTCPTQENRTQNAAATQRGRYMDGAHQSTAPQAACLSQRSRALQNHFQAQASKITRTQTAVQASRAGGTAPCSAAENRRSQSGSVCGVSQNSRSQAGGACGAAQSCRPAQPTRTQQTAMRAALQGHTGAQARARLAQQPMKRLYGSCQNF